MKKQLPVIVHRVGEVNIERLKAAINRAYFEKNKEDAGETTSSSLHTTQGIDLEKTIPEARD